MFIYKAHFYQPMTMKIYARLSDGIWKKNMEEVFENLKKLLVDLNAHMVPDLQTASFKFRMT